MEENQKPTGETTTPETTEYDLANAEIEKILGSTQPKHLGEGLVKGMGYMVRGALRAGGALVVSTVCCVVMRRDMMPCWYAMLVLWNKSTRIESKDELFSIIIDRSFPWKVVFGFPRFFPCFICLDSNNAIPNTAECGWILVVNPSFFVFSHWNDERHHEIDMIFWFPYSWPFV